VTFHALDPLKRWRYLQLRSLGHVRTQAAELAGISYSTAQRIDREQATHCVICRRPLVDR
jgi:hypothetical protein